MKRLEMLWEFYWEVVPKVSLMLLRGKTVEENKATGSRIILHTTDFDDPNRCPFCGQERRII